MSIVLVFCLVLGARGSYGSVLAPEHVLGSLYAGYGGEYAAKYDNYEPKSYAYEYGVSDPHTGDHKTQWETKDKDGTVRGSYSLLEPDGTTRIVDYIADEHGFRAVVKKVGIHGASVESHGGAEEEIGVPQVAVAHVAHQEPIYEAPIAYKSYDGGYEDYTGLQPVLGDVYTKPIEYIHAPKAERFLINVPEHQIPTAYSQNALIPKAEGLKFSLPQEYYSQEYIPQEKYFLPEEYHVPPQYTVPEAKHFATEYILPKYKLVHAPIPVSAPEYNTGKGYQVLAPYYPKVPQVTKEYVLPQGPADTVAHSYVQEHRYNTPKAAAEVLVTAPEGYWSAPEVLPRPHGQYNLNLDYGY